MSISELCPRPPHKRSINYIHGWNKPCRKQEELLPYPDWYDGIRIGINGDRYYGKPKRKRIVKSKPRERLTREQKLQRARDRLSLKSK